MEWVSSLRGIRRPWFIRLDRLAFTKDALDAALVMNVISGHDTADSTSATEPVPDYTKGLTKDLKGMKIGIPKEYFGDGLEEGVKKEIMKAVEEYKKMGAEIIDVSLPHSKYGVGVYYIITPSEVSSNLARFDGIRYGYSDESGKELIEIYKHSRGKGFGPEAKRRIMLGTYALSAGYFDAYYLKAQRVRTIIKEELDQVLETVDVILTPTSPHIAFKIGEQSSDPLKMYLEDIYVTGASLAGLPAISIPVGLSEGMPVGMQLIGSRFGEEMLYLAGGAIEGVLGFGDRKLIVV